MSVFADSFPMAAINDGSRSHKVEKILSMKWHYQALSQESYQNLTLLARKALGWVNQEIDAVMQSLTTQLEALPYDELAKRAEAQVKTAKTTDVAKSRHGRR